MNKHTVTPITFMIYPHPDMLHEPEPDMFHEPEPTTEPDTPDSRLAEYLIEALSSKNAEINELRHQNNKLQGEIAQAHAALAMAREIAQARAALAMAHDKLLRP